MNELKVLIKPILDKSSANRVKSQMSSSSGGGGAGGLLGKKGIGGLLSKATLATAVIGIVAVGIKKIVSRLAEASPMLSGIFQQMKNAINLFLMPIGNALALWLQPLSQSMMGVAVQFNRLFAQHGFIKALGVTFGYQLTLLGQDIFKGIATTGASLLSGIGRFIEPIFQMPVAIANAIKGIIPNIGGSVTQSASGIISQAGGILGGVGRAIGGLIPFASGGGIVTGPTPALVGEAGPEAIIPLDKLNQGVTINIVGDVFGMPDFEQRVLTAVNRASGNRRYYA